VSRCFYLSLGTTADGIVCRCRLILFTHPGQHPHAGRVLGGKPPKASLSKSIHDVSVPHPGREPSRVWSRAVASQDMAIARDELLGDPLPSIQKRSHRFDLQFRGFCFVHVCSRSFCPREKRATEASFAAFSSPPLACNPPAALFRAVSSVASHVLFDMLLLCVREEFTANALRRAMLRHQAQRIFNSATFFVH